MNVNSLLTILLYKPACFVLDLSLLCTCGIDYVMMHEQYT